MYHEVEFYSKGYVMKKFVSLFVAALLLVAVVSCASVTSHANAVVNQGVPAGVMLNADVIVSKLTNHANGFTGGWTKNDSLQIDDMARDALTRQLPVWMPSTGWLHWRQPRWLQD